MTKLGALVQLEISFVNGTVGNICTRNTQTDRHTNTHSEHKVYNQPLPSSADDKYYVISGVNFH